MSIDEKVLEGKYIFLQNDEQYSEESFTLMREDSINGNFLYQSDILCRVPSGEFLKINVDYETTNSFDPVSVKVFRSLGDKTSTEQYSIDLVDKRVQYTFTNNDNTEVYEKSLTGKFHISTPAFVTSTLMTQMKKISITQKTIYNVITADNIWTYQNPFSESSIEVELRSLDSVEITLNEKALNTTHCQIRELTNENSGATETADFYLSKHFNIPYKAIFPANVEVRIDRLRTFETGYRSIFKK